MDSGWNRDSDSQPESESDWQSEYDYYCDGHSDCETWYWNCCCGTVTDVICQCWHCAAAALMCPSHGLTVRAFRGKSRSTGTEARTVTMLVQPLGD